MKKLFLAALLASTLGLASGALALSKESTIAVLDVQSVFEQTDMAKKVAMELKDKSTEIRKRFEKVDADLANREQELRQKRAALSEEKFVEEVAELRRVSREYRSEFQVEQDKLRAKKRTLDKKVTNEIKTVVEELAKEMEFNAVIGRAYLIFADGTVDITDEVVARVNKNLSTSNDKEGL